MFNYVRNYYTLEDIRKSLELYKNYNGPFSMLNASSGFISFMNKCLLYSNYSEIEGTIEDAQGYECFVNYIWPRFYNEAVIYVDPDESEDFVKKFTETKVGQIFAWWKSSMDKYSLLIQNLENNKAKLLDDVKSVSTSRFNDTPQNSGDFSDDQHTSTVTRTENSSNVGTMMQRLNEIEDNIKQLYIDWSNEFRKFIIWSVN